MGRKEAALLCCWSSSNTMCPWLRSILPYQVTSSSIQPLATIDINRKLGAVHLLGGAATPSNTTAPRPRFTSVPSGILIHPAVSPQQTWAKNWAGLCPFFLGEAGSPSNTKSPGPRPTSIPSHILVHLAVWPQRTLAENWRLCPLRGGGAGSPSNTMSPRLRPTSVPSGILMHTAVWPQ